jgi:PPP family 3-phenylpropionic acid transporter
MGGRISVFFAAAFAVMGLTLPFFNVWLESRGLSLGEIAAIAIIGNLVRLLSGPAIALLADWWRDHRRMLMLVAWGIFAGWLAMTRATGFWTIVACHIFIAVMMSGMLPLIETVAMAAVRSHGLDYGRMRLWGSASFIAASIAGGWLVDWQGIAIAVWLMVACALAGGIAGHLLPATGGGAGLRSARAPLRLADTLALVRAPAFLAFLLTAGAVQGAHSTMYVYGALHWQRLGISPGGIGALWAVAVIVEIALFAVSTRLMSRSGPIQFMAWGAAAAVLRWALMAFDPPAWLLVLLQASHALTYGASHIGAVHFISRAVPERQAGTAQALYAAVVTLAAMIATQVSGIVYPAAGASSYMFMAIIAAVGLVAVGAMRRLWSGGPLLLR